MNFKDVYMVKVAKVIKVIGDKTMTFANRRELGNATRGAEEAKLLNEISGNKYVAKMPIASRDTIHAPLATANSATPISDAAKAPGSRLSRIGTHMGKNWPAYAALGAAGLAGGAYLSSKKRKEKSAA